jgi:hypothetical protein
MPMLLERWGCWAVGRREHLLTASGRIPRIRGRAPRIGGHVPRIGGSAPCVGGRTPRIGGRAVGSRCRVEIHHCGRRGGATSSQKGG